MNKDNREAEELIFRQVRIQYSKFKKNDPLIKLYLLGAERRRTRDSGESVEVVFTLRVSVYLLPIL